MRGGGLAVLRVPTLWFVALAHDDDGAAGLYPQHYAMTFLGLITGLRPSSLRPLRRRGPEADVLWEKGRIMLRRSQTLGDEVMRTTKQKRRYPIDLPEEAMSILRWHVDTQPVTPEMEESDRSPLPEHHGRLPFAVRVERALRRRRRDDRAR